MADKAMPLEPDVLKNVRAQMEAKPAAKKQRVADGDAPNAGLDPETSLSGEFGLDLALQGGVSLGLTAFALNTDNAISYCGDFATACTTTIPTGYTNLYENVPGITKRRGAELTVTAPIGAAWSLTGSYTYTDAYDPSGARLVYVPRNTVQATFAGPISDRLKAQVALSHMSDETSGSAVVPAYTVVNVTTTYSLNPTTEVYTRLENLFDTTYQTRLGYATSGRALYVGLRKSF
ncbi:MAG: TonB-dependent receptor [Rhodobacteraceae bacterium]|nr:TonB-dependent receptor [Paracoccaceae bacterium]